MHVRGAGSAWGASDGFADLLAHQQSPLLQPLTAADLADKRVAYVHIEHFAGISGATLGFEMAGVKLDLHLATELNGECRSVIRAHFPGCAIFKEFEALTTDRAANILEGALAPFLEEMSVVVAHDDVKRCASTE